MGSPVMGVELVVGSEDMQFHNDVGHIHHVPTHQNLRVQIHYVVFHLRIGDSMLSIHDFHILDIFLLSRRTHLAVEDTMERKNPYDFYLILATTIALFIISVICIYGMFHFKLAQIHEMPTALKVQHMNRMNAIISPFLIGLILLLGICVPKRLLPTTWLNRFSLILFVLVIIVCLRLGITLGLKLILITSLILQVTVLVMALVGSKRLNFEKKGYWLRVGSSLIHLGLILFLLDLFFYKKPTLHLVLFWISTVAAVLGMIFCFYSNAVVRLIRRNSEL